MSNISNGKKDNGGKHEPPSASEALLDPKKA